MLHLNTLDPSTFSLLKELSKSPLLQRRRLVGGTTLALQYGRRKSIDLEFFGSITSDKEEYPDYSRFRAVLSLGYFADAERQPDPIMFTDESWNDIKLFISNQLKTLCT